MMMQSAGFKISSFLNHNTIKKRNETEINLLFDTENLDHGQTEPMLIWNVVHDKQSIKRNTIYIPEEVKYVSSMKLGNIYFKTPDNKLNTSSYQLLVQEFVTQSFIHVNSNFHFYLNGWIHTKTDFDEFKVTVEENITELFVENKGNYIFNEPFLIPKKFTFRLLERFNYIDFDFNNTKYTIPLILRCKI